VPLFEPIDGVLRVQNIAFAGSVSGCQRLCSRLGWCIMSQTFQTMFFKVSMELLQVVVHIELISLLLSLGYTFSLFHFFNFKF
jgi:hypothetical protein